MIAKILYEGVSNLTLIDFFEEIDDYIYDMLYNNDSLIPYIILAVAIYVINMVRQKIITRKLNKELNKE